MIFLSGRKIQTSTKLYLTLSCLVALVLAALLFLGDIFKSVRVYADPTESHVTSLRSGILEGLGIADVALVLDQKLVYVGYTRQGAGPGKFHFLAYPKLMSFHDMLICGVIDIRVPSSALSTIKKRVRKLQSNDWYSLISSAPKVDETLQVRFARRYIEICASENDMAVGLTSDKPILGDIQGGPKQIPGVLTGDTFALWPWSIYPVLLEEEASSVRLKIVAFNQRGWLLPMNSSR